MRRYTVLDDRPHGWLVHHDYLGTVATFERRQDAEDHRSRLNREEQQREWDMRTRELERQAEEARRSTLRLAAATAVVVVAFFFAGWVAPWIVGLFS